MASCPWIPWCLSFNPSREERVLKRAKAYQMAHHPHNFNNRYMCIVCECMWCMCACVRVYVCVSVTLNGPTHSTTTFTLDAPHSVFPSFLFFSFFLFHPIHIQDANQLKLDVSDKPTSRMKQEAPIFTLFFLYHT